MNKRLFFALFGVFLTLFAGAQSIQPERISITEGLSSAFANGIFQDSCGLIWVPTQNGLNVYDNHNTANYTNLDPGEYIFRVRGSNRDGIWNNEGLAIKFIILPPWWKTTVAYVLYYLLFCGLAFGFDRFQRQRLLARERENCHGGRVEFCYNHTCIIFKIINI